MKRRRNGLIVLLIICICLTAVPCEALAEENMEEDRMVTEEADSEEKEPRKLENDDPGWGRYSGYASPDFYGPMSRAAGSGIQHDSRFNGYIIQNGIDVSEWNKEIDWAKVKEAGYEFAIIRVAGTWARAAGGQYMDNRAIENIEGALAAGMSVGVYFFSQAISTKEAEIEAQFILDAIQPYKSRITLPVVFDFEFYSDFDGEGGRLYDANLSKSKATKICNKFSDIVSAAGYTPMLYANRVMLEEHLKPDELTSTVWLAQWAEAATYAGDYEYWQYSAAGKVPGMTGEVDLDFRYVQKGPLTITSRGVNSIKLEWKPVKGVTGYNIYRKKTGGTYELAGSVSGENSVTYKDKNLAEGTSYTYRVRAYTDTEAGRQNGFYTKTATGTTKITAPVMTGKAKAFDTLKLSWKKAASASGYQLQRYDSAKKKYRTLKIISGKSKVSYTDKGLNAKKTYKYRVRAYKNVNSKKVYSSWSDEIRVKTLKAVKGTVNVDYVNLRSGAGKSYKSLKTVRKNKKLTVNGSSGNWYRVSVKVNGKKRNAYILKKYVKLNK